jgi:hypothetical protein
VKFRCIHEFVLDAEDSVDFDLKLARYRGLVDAASAKLDMGYEPGIMHGVVIIGSEEMEPSDDEPIERLFDG